MFSKAMQSLHYTTNRTTDFSCLYFRKRSRNTPTGRRALKCSARPCSLHYTANQTTDFFCGVRTRLRNTPIGRRALKCSARPCSLRIIHPTRQQTFFWWFQDKIKKYADRKDSNEMLSKAMKSLHYTADTTTDLSWLYFRTRSRNTPTGRRALKCSANLCSLCILQPTR